MTSAMHELVKDALEVGRKEFESGRSKDQWRSACYYLAGQLEIAIRDTSAGYSRLPPQKPTRALKVDRKDAPPLAVSKY